jgi:hypothetical protein
MEQEI